MYKMCRHRCVKTRGILTTLILSYTVFLIVSMVFMAISYCHLYSNACEHARSVVVSHLNQASSITDSYVERAQQTLLALCTDAHVAAFSNARYPLDGTDYYRLWQVVQVISSQSSANPLLDKLFVYFGGIDSVVDVNTRTSSLEYYNENLKFTDQSYDQWLGFLAQRGYFSANGAQTLPDGSRYIPFTMALPLGVIGKSTAVGYMDVSYIESLFTGIGADNEYSVLIALDGDLLCTLGRATEYGKWISNNSGFCFESNGENSYLQMSITRPGGWVYYCAFNARAYLDALASTRDFIWQMLIIELAGGLLCAILLTLNSYTPLRRLMHVLNGANPTNIAGKNDMQQMLDAASNLISENSSLTEQLRQQQPLLRAGLIQQILSGDNDMFHDILKQFGITFEYDAFCVTIIGSDNTLAGEASTLFYFTLNSVLSDWLEKRHAGHVAIFYSDRITVLLNTNLDEMPRLISDMISYLESSLNFTPIAGVSSNVHSLSDAHIARNQAEEAFNYAYAWRISGITFYDRISHEPKTYVLSPAQEQDLINGLQNGESQYVCDMIRHIFNSARNEQLVHIRMLAYCIISILMRTLANWKTDNSLMDDLDDLGTRIDTCTSPDKLMEELAIAASKVASESRKLQITTYNHIIHRAVEIIEMRYADCALSQATIAQELELNPSYLSHIFKRHTGCCFVDYLNNIRLEHACSYLKSTALSIQIISERCGYTSAGYFNRVFKKKFGLTPSQYRDGIVYSPTDDPIRDYGVIGKTQ